MNNLIPFVNKLYNVLTAVGREVMPLPKIVVIGAQSAGKSSVLESLVGKSFLPRGLGAVTRRPMILRLTHVDDHRAQEYGKFMHMPDVLFRDFTEIKKEIEQETIRKAGPNRAICEDPIVLEIYSPKVVNLTLVDLPGLTKVPVGDQPADIDNQVKQLSMKYIRQHSTIILAVLAANTDMSTNECLQMARQVDPEGDRTLAVITKLDIMDAGTNASDMLTGKVIPVRLGIVGVINRSHLDNMAEKTIEECQKDEKTFFQTKYPNLCHLHGSQYLGNILNKILMNHINRALPNLKQAVTAKRMSIQEELGLIDEGLDNNQIILREVSQYADSYKGALSGGLKHLDTKELSGGARISYIFQEIFASKLDSLNPMAALTEQQLLTALRNSEGTRCEALFIPELCFENLMRRQLLQLEEPCFYLVGLIHDELLSMVRSCANSTRVRRFPKLFDAIYAIVEDLLNERLYATKSLVKQILDMELAYINARSITAQNDLDLEELSNAYVTEKVLGLPKSKSTSISRSIVSIPTSLQTEVEKCDYQKECPNECAKESSFVGGWLSSLILPSNKVLTTIHQNPRTTPSPSEAIFPRREGTVTVIYSEIQRKHIQILEHLIFNYFNATRKTIKASVPKAIMLKMVNDMHESIYKELLTRLYKTENVESLLWEPEEIQRHRVYLNNSLRALRTAEKMLWEMREESSKLLLTP